MLRKGFLWCCFFLSILSALGVYLGFLHQFNPLASAIALVVSAAAAFLLIRGEKGKKRGLGETWLLTAAIIIFAAIMLFLILPEFTYPITCSDFMRHANYSRIDAQNGGYTWEGFFLTSHSYPRQYRAIPSLLFPFIPDTYASNSLLGVLFLLLSIAGVFLVAEKVLPKKWASVAAFLFAFSITTIWVMDAGYLPQMMGQLFFIASFLLYMEKRKGLMVLTLIGLTAYLPFLALFGLFLLADAFFQKKRFAGIKRQFVPLVVAVLAIFPESIGLLVQRIIRPDRAVNIMLIKGGISFPNLIAIIPLLPALLGLKDSFFGSEAEKKKLREVSSWVAATIAFTVLILLFFAANLLLHFTVVAIHQLYIPAKAFYLLVVPASILSAYGLRRLTIGINPRFGAVLLALLLFFHLFYFAGYIPRILENKSFPASFYTVARYTHSLKGPFSLGIDECVLRAPKVDWHRFPYNSLYDSPDPYTENYCRYQEIGRIFEFNWAMAEPEQGKPWKKVVDEKGDYVVKIGAEDTDFLLTNCRKLDEPIAAEAGEFRLYRVGG